MGEHITGIFCGFCQPHDAAFNALIQRYPATAFISLAYHYDPNFPFGDPADSNFDRMHRWYGVEPNVGTIDHLPVKGDDDWIDGKSINSDMNSSASSGAGEESKSFYTDLVSAIDAELRRPPEAFFHLQARVADGQIHVQVHVDSIVGNHPKTYLRLLVVEDTVSLFHPLYWYRQRAKQIGSESFPLRREHHMVVRAAAHEKTLPLGLSLHVPDTVLYTFDVTAIQQRLLRYQTAGVSALRVYRPEYVTNTADVNYQRKIIETFPDAHDWQIDLKRLHVVAFVQDAHTGEVLQTAMLRVIC